MPVYASGRGSFPTMSDLVRREDESRRASHRAEAKLSHEFSQAGGIDEAKRYTLSVHKREQDQVRQELHNIRNSYNRNNVIMMQNPSNLKHANPQLAEDIEEQEFIRSQENKGQENRNRGIPKNYGRNYFGYKSRPGSNRPHFENMKAIKDKYSNVKNYYEYKGPKQMDKKTREKLTQQKRQNMSVQEKVKSFGLSPKSKTETLGTNGYPVVPATRLSLTENKTEPKYENPNKDSSNEDKTTVSTTTATTMTPTEKSNLEPAKQVDTGGALAYRRKSSENAADKQKPSRTNQNNTIPEVAEHQNENDSPVLPPQLPERRTSRAPRRSSDATSVIASTMTLPPHRTAKPKTALDLVFDADTYAPDGRLRTVHTLPDVDKAYREARQARYVRTKYKRDVEIELSVSDIFKR